MNEDAQFECTACHITHDDGEKVMTACRLCGKLHCKDCVDEYGRCVACAEKAPEEQSS
ncbi:MAG TPA: hypothetical protein VLT88_15065 [Desulfosarcina sp.]|nr:hypothetical protein [Desulfosarcina sp.]